MQGPTYVGQFPGKTAYSDWAQQALGYFQQKKAAKQADEQRLAAEEQAKLLAQQKQAEEEAKREAEQIAALIDKRPELRESLAKQVQEKAPLVWKYLGALRYDVPMSGFDTRRVAIGDSLGRGDTPSNTFDLTAGYQEMTGATAPAGLVGASVQREALGGDEAAYRKAAEIDAKLQRSPQEIAQEATTQRGQNMTSASSKYSADSSAASSRYSADSSATGRAEAAAAKAAETAAADEKTKAKDHIDKFAKELKGKVTKAEAAVTDLTKRVRDAEAEGGGGWWQSGTYKTLTTELEVAQSYLEKQQRKKFDFEVRIGLKNRDGSFTAIGQAARKQVSAGSRQAAPALPQRPAGPRQNAPAPDLTGLSKEALDRLAAGGM